MVMLSTDTLARSISQLFYTSFLIFFLSVKSKKKTYHLTGSIITDFHVSCSLLLFFVIETTFACFLSAPGIWYTNECMFQVTFFLP